MITEPTTIVCETEITSAEAMSETSDSGALSGLEVRVKDVIEKEDKTSPENIRKIC